MNACQSKILTQWNEAPASEKATDELLCYLGALSDAVCAGHKSSLEPAWGSKGPFALGLAKDAQKHIRTALASALPPKEPLLHDLEVSHSETDCLADPSGGSGEIVIINEIIKGFTCLPTTISPPALLHPSL